MLEGLFKSRRWPIGLDIGVDSIKVLQLQRLGRVLRVSASGQYRLGAGTAKSGAEYRKAVVAGIREIMRQGKFAGRNVVSAIPTSRLSIKNIRTAPMPEKELAEAVRWEAGERFNFEVSPDRLRWINAGQVRQGDEIRDEIIMIALSAETMEEHLAILDEARLVPEHIEIQPVALFRAFRQFLRRRDDEQAVSIVVDVGKGGTQLVVSKGSNILFIKQIDIGGAKLTEAVVKQLHLNFEDAQDLRVRMMKDSGECAGANPPGEAGCAPQMRSSVDATVRDAMRSEAQELAREVSLCLRYCSVTFRGLRPDCVIVVGGEAYDASLVSLLAENLGIGCAIGRPFRNIDVSGMAVSANRRGTLAEWAVCAGLAQSELSSRGITGESDYAEHRLSA
jgi:type IV pilus assembly protein PilM